MIAYTNRPVLLSTVQFADELETGAANCRDLLDRADALGFDGIELRREGWAGYETELPRVRRRAEVLGATVTYATFSELLCCERGEGREMLLHDIDTAAELGSPFLRVFLGRTPEAGHEQWDAAREAIEHATERGIYLVLENRNASPGSTLEEIVHAVETIDAPELRVNVDVGNYYQNDVDVVSAIDALADRIRYVHLVDPTAPDGSLGGGELPMDEIVDALDALPQEVYYCFEFGGGDDPEAAIRDSAAFMESRAD